MKKTLTILALLAATPTGFAVAGEGCFVPLADWQPRDVVAEFAEQNGWAVRRIKVDDGCYEIYARDANGRAIEAKVNPATLEIIKIEFEEMGHDDHGEDHKSED